MNYTFEQHGRRPIVAFAVALGMIMTAIGIAYGAPWQFSAITGVSTLMALAILVQNRHSGMRLEGDTLTLFSGRWRHVIDVRTIRSVRVTRWSDGQPSISLELADARPYRLPGYCFGSAQELTDTFRRRGIAVT